MMKKGWVDDPKSGMVYCTFCQAIFGSNLYNDCVVHIVYVRRAIVEMEAQLGDYILSQTLAVLRFVRNTIYSADVVAA